MQSPPSYSGVGKRKSNVGLIIGIVVLCLCVCCVLPVAVIGGLGYKAVKTAGGMMGCSANMQAQRNALVAYSKKNGGKLPPATNWLKDIAPYLQTPVIPPTFKTEPVTSQICDPGAGTGINYNSDVAGKKFADIRDQGSVFLFEAPGEGGSSKFKELSYETSPKFIGSARRGWLTIEADSAPYVIGQNGQKAPVQVTESGASINTKQ